MAELIFEIGCEEMPARFVLPAIEQLRYLAQVHLEKQGLHDREQYEQRFVYGTPRRLALIVKGLKDKQGDREEESLGPPVRAAYDAKGNPTKAAVGFAKSQGVGVGDLLTVDTEKGQRVAVRKVVPGRPAMGVLAELLPYFVEALHFPKTMRWGREKFRFARPIHWLLALLEGQVVSFTLAGIESGNLTYGHRFLAPQAIEIKGAGEYLDKLRAASVIADRDQRRDLVIQQVAAAAQQVQGRLAEETRQALIEENTDLVEQATACCGSFDAEFLAVPRPVIIAAMAEHQRYFALQDADGNLLPNFIAVNNTRPRNLAVVTRGHQRVLRARLADARFFFEEDRRQPLISFLDKLKDVTYHAKLGSSLDKVERFTALAGFLAQELGLPPARVAAVQRTARLAKCDLVTGMVGEFPSLQGVVGGEYAHLDNEPAEVAAGIAGHYLPAGADSPLPMELTGVLVGLADRLDTICGLFGIGEVPTGAADPYGLRRAAIAVIRLISEKGLALSLERLLDQALQGLAGRLGRETSEVRQEVTQFFSARLAGILAEQGVPTDVASAVLAAGLDDLTATVARARALAAVKDTPEFAPLAIGLKRVMNILKKEAAQVPQGPPEPSLMSEPAEQALHQAFSGLAQEAAELFERGDFAAFLGRVSALKDPIDRFFDDVMVMVEDEGVRRNRLALLNQMARLFGGFARFEYLQLV
ncbi:MAG: glycine--tRNA ligase subunit beta [Desulfarculus sp.]|nr:MAG: glycine--tRNA ligase subunit beta [Desulfarculus sp.]